PATATPSLSTLSLHDALPICVAQHHQVARAGEHLFLDPVHLGLQRVDVAQSLDAGLAGNDGVEQHHRTEAAADAVEERQAEHLRSEEHTSELQSRENLVCRLL